MTGGDYHSIMDVQEEARAWRRKAYPETSGILFQALGVGEESGELQHAVLKYMQGIRGYDREKTRVEVADAIGDIFIYACGVADTLDIDVVDAICKAWEHVKERNITQGSDVGQSTPMANGWHDGRNSGVRVGDGNIQENNF